MVKEKYYLSRLNHPFMDFDISVVRNMPLTPIEDMEEALIIFLEQIGYIARKPGTDSARESIPVRLFIDCFIKRIDKAWTVEDMSIELDTSKPTIYRHLNKLKAMDLLEEVQVETSNPDLTRKGYRLRYGNLSKAWNFVEAHVEVAMENYRRSVDHIQKMIDTEQE